MSYSKTDFISDLLASKRIHVAEKNRIIELTKKELETFDKDNLEIKKRIDDIEGKIKNLPIKTKNEIKPISSSRKNALPKYINPKYLSDFLIEYNQDPILKYTCHTIDNKDSLQSILDICKIKSYDFALHLDQIKKNYNSLNFKAKYVNNVLVNVKTLIAIYLGTYPGQEDWSEIKEIRWISPELKKWAKDNPGKVPNPSDEFQEEKFGFETIELKNGNSLTNFSELVIYFKNIFHFKSSNKLRTKLEDVIFLHFNEEDEYEILFDESFSDEMELFTYSDSLMQAFSKILKMSKKQFANELLNVKLFLEYDDNNLKEFKIVIMNSIKFNKHYNSFMSDDQVDKRGRYGDSFTDLINKQINGLCNLYIRAEFEDQKCIGTVNIWDGLPLVFKQTDQHIEGVEFILKMY